MRLLPLLAALFGTLLLPPALRAQTPPAAPTAPTVPPAAADATNKPAKKPRATTKTVRGTIVLLDAGAKTLTLKPDAGETISATIPVDAVFAKNGKTAKGSDFAASDKVSARLFFAADGAVSLVQLSDTASYDRDRKQIATGTVAASGPGKLDLKRADGSTITFRVSDKSVIRKAGAAATIKDYAAGATVAVKPRGLPGGSVMAAIISDTPDDVNVAYLDERVSWKGTIESLDAVGATLTITRDDGAKRTVVVAPDAAIKRGKTTLALKDLALGTVVTLHLTKPEAGKTQRTADRITAAAAGGG